MPFKPKRPHPQSNPPLNISLKRRRSHIEVLLLSHTHKTRKTPRRPLPHQILLLPPTTRIRHDTIRITNILFDEAFVVMRNAAGDGVEWEPPRPDFGDWSV